MPAILIHGVPDTHHVWDDVRRHLTRSDVEAWDLPGFGAPRPEGFDSTKEEYVTWLIDRLAGVGEPVDLVGHDWGCLLTARVASVRPDLIRSWAGGNGPISAEYVWHPLAKLWQDPVAGDRWAQEYDAAAFAKDLTDSLQVPAEPAEKAAGRVDETMRDSILKLYRSALTVGAEWEPQLANLSAPSLLFWGALDPVCATEFGEKMAESLRASRLLELDSSHWTLLQRPAEVAAALEEHWSSSAGD
ncbi:alpha/beta fold hydrolase [Streptomyces sp. NPDC007903]|uniref:alpha/beta fold hydrolase n=1 Tax=Streptomyces sp. NPDC007903 TaxID=3364786 RepID=UPI0036EAB476